MKTAGQCWEWEGQTNGSGYGCWYENGRTIYAHRAAYERHVAPIPEGRVIDHLCRNTLCVNPEHLEAVTHRENITRGDHFTNNFARLKTHCGQGHEFTPENTYIIPSTGSRHCRECRRAWRRR